MTPAGTPVTARIRVELGDRSYPVVVGAGLLDDLPVHVAPPEAAGTALVVTQPPIADHADRAADALRRDGLDVHVEQIVDGEQAKSLAVLGDLYDTCADIPLHRTDVVVAVGGGVVGDLAGFLAATYNRGVAALQVPTTLLAQVDAAIGGKTGINLEAGKNLVGAFHQPVGVLADVGALATLPERIRREGLGEVVKYGLIRDGAILDLLEEDPDAAVAGEPETALELVAASARVKAAVVAADEREAGERAHLNLGHTFGHALETLTGYDGVLHGEAVAVGTVVALRLGQRLGLTPDALADRGVAVLDALGLPTAAPALDRRAVWATMARDKKARGGEVRFVLLEDLGRPVLAVPERGDVDAAIDAVEG